MSENGPIVDLNARAFPRLAKTALADGTLRSALDKVTAEFAQRRGEALESVPHWEALREHARAIKEHTLAHLDTYLDQFVEQAEARGVQVHFARDRAEACALVGAIAEEVGARTVVKSKSMVTEEIGLNAHLEQAGMDPVETDLGEWIIQLAGEKPSHIIAPAIHYTRSQVGDLFRKELGVPDSDDVDELTAVARRFLRKRFAEADVGVSGVNFLVAETGSFMVIENEGNARMCTSLPRVHVAVTGIEKVLPRLADLDVFLRLLPRSGTGQHLTAYTTLFTGTKRYPDEEGPEALHLVLLDNGRSAQLADPLRRQALACIRCGACLNVCPVYKQVGGHAYGSVYPGPIGSVITPALAGQESAGNLPHASSLCGACKDVCPVKIDLPELLLDLRAEGEEGSALERKAFGLWSQLARSSQGAALMGGFLTRVLRGGEGRTLAGRWLGSPLASLLAQIIRPLAIWRRTRTLPPMPSRSFRQLWRDELRDKVRDKEGDA